MLCSILSPEILLFPEAVRMALSVTTSFTPAPFPCYFSINSFSCYFSINKLLKFLAPQHFNPPFPPCSLSHLFGSFSFTNSPTLEIYCTGSLGKHCCDMIFLLNINKEIIIWHPAAELEANPVDFSRLKQLFEPAAFHCLATWAPNCLRLLWWWFSNADILSKRWSRASAILTLQLQGFPPLPCLLFGNMK